MSEQGLQYQLVTIKFTGGMDTKTDEKLVLPTKFHRLRNCALSDNGALDRRRPHINLIQAQQGHALATLGNEMLTVNGTSMSRIIAPRDVLSSTQFTAQPTAQLMPNVAIRAKDVVAPGGWQDNVDCAYGYGLVVYVWRGLTIASTPVPTGIFMKVVDEATGSTVIAEAKISSTTTALFPRVVFEPGASKFLIFYMLTARTAILGRAYEPAVSLTTIQTETSVASGYTASTYPTAFDACAFSGGAAVSFLHNGGVTDIVARYSGGWSVVLNAVAAPTATFPENHITGVANCTDGAWLYTFIDNDSGSSHPGVYSGNVYSSALALVSVATLLDGHVATALGLSTIVALAGTGGAVDIYTDEISSVNGDAYVPIRHAVATWSGTAWGSITATNLTSSACSYTATGVSGACGPQGPFILGKPFRSTASGSPRLPVYMVDNFPNGTLLITGSNNPGLQNSAFILDGATGVVLGKALGGTLGTNLATAYPSHPTPTSVVATPSGFAMAARVQGQLSLLKGVDYTPTGIDRLSFSENLSAPISHAELGGALYMANGFLTEYSGASAFEAVTHLFPEGIVLTALAGVGGTAAGIYQAVAIYEWTDNAGSTHQSAPSPAASITLTGASGSSSFSVAVPTLLLTQQAITISVYVTQASGTIFNFYGSIANNQAASYVTVNVGGGASNWAPNQLLYTQPDQAGTTLPNYAPGPATLVGVHQNRLFANVTDQPNRFAYSQQLISGVGLQFSDALGGEVPSVAGAITGFAELDEKVFIFCEHKIYAIVGTGPSASGGFNNYSDPIEIPSDVGCRDSFSVVKMPLGIMFATLKGMYLLDRAMGVKFIGDGVYYYRNSTVLSAVMLEDSQQVRFETSGGVRLVYSYAVDAWSTDIVAAGVGTYLPLDAIWWPTTGQYVTISAANGLNADSLTQAGTTNAGDQVGAQAETAYPFTAITAFVALAGLEGFQRVRWAYFTASGATTTSDTVAITVDYDDTYTWDGVPSPDAYTVTQDLSAITFPIANAIDIRTKLHRQKCKSVAFQLTFTPNSTSGYSVYALQALTLQIGVKRGTNKLRAAQSIG